MTINSFFYEELSTAEHRAALMRNDLWHIVVAAMNVVPKEMKVGAIKFYENQAAALEVELLNNVGFLVAHAMVAPSHLGRKTVLKHKLSLINDPFSIRSSGGLSSTRAKYVAGKIRSKTDPSIRDLIIRAVRYAKFAPHAIVNRAAHTVLGKINGGRPPHSPFASLNESLVTQLVRVFVDDMHRSEISTADLAEIHRGFDKFKKEKARVGETISAVQEFFSRDKWVIVSSLNEDDWTGGSMNKGRVIVGAISCQPLLAAFDYFAKNFALPSCNIGEDSFAYCQEIVPFTPYTSFEQIPDDIRKSIEVEFMMRKVARGTDSIYPKMDTGAKDVWQEGGQVIWRDYGEGTVTIIDKT